MLFTKDFSTVSGVSPDARVQIFRAHFSAPGEFEAMAVDAYAIHTERALVLCDTLLCPDDMQRVCSASGVDRTEKQLLVINSHADWDHVWGTHYLVEHYAPTIIAHEYCRTRLLSDEEKHLLREYQEKFSVFHSVILVPPKVTFRDTLTIYGGDLTLELFPAPGHQPDQIALWIPEIRLLLAFDALEYPLPGIGSPELVPAMFRSIERFQELQPAHVLCSHRENSSSPALITQNLSYLRQIEQRSRALLARQQITEEDLSDPARLIGYPYAEARAHVQSRIDDGYYEMTHAENIRCILRYCLKHP
ncbi:MAG TPA: MBL fold metallo-hydrolase [Ktedonobacteraceae bacterium]|jgi:glyoxylase-like metal-dependent hydrolase (beta-lactamase superfamily II)|nr:MBL fold metallo-hydrolase [Ktedonobacteraceae bacterium]